MINTPQLYEQFNNGQIGNGYDIISIESGAHPNILSLPKLYANANYRNVKFTDEHDNEVILSPKLKLLFTEYAAGTDLALGLPDSYEEYMLYYEESVNATKADFDYIETWQNVLSLGITDGPNSNVAFELSQRVDKLQSQEILKNISFIVQPHSHHLLNVTRFIEHLPRLTLAGFMINALSKTQLETFLHNQDLPEDWQYVIHEAGFVYFKPNPEAANNSLFDRIVSLLS